MDTKIAYKNFPSSNNKIFSFKSILIFVAMYRKRVLFLCTYSIITLGLFICSYYQWNELFLRIKLCPDDAIFRSINRKQLKACVKLHISCDSACVFFLNFRSACCIERLLTVNGSHVRSLVRFSDFSDKMCLLMN